MTDRRGARIVRAEVCKAPVDAAELAAATGIDDRRMLYTKREWKKTSMKYFVENS